MESLNTYRYSFPRPQYMTTNKYQLIDMFAIFNRRTTVKSEKCAKLNEFKLYEVEMNSCC